MKTVTIRLKSGDIITMSGSDAGYSIKAAGNTAYVTAWENSRDREITKVYLLSDVAEIDFKLDK